MPEPSGWIDVEPSCRCASAGAGLRGPGVEAYRSRPRMSSTAGRVRLGIVGGVVLIAAWSMATASVPPAAAVADTEIVPVRVVGGLRQAVAFTFDPLGRIWFVEKSAANVRIFDPASGDTRRFMHVPHVVSRAEQGLVGIELHPRFPERPWVYLYATRLVDGALRDQLLRVTAVEDRGTKQRVLWESPASEYAQHSGGRLLFGPDDMLYVAVGDALVPAAAQDPSSDRGKILRMTDDGTPAPDNPDPNSLVFASGIRNSFGLAFDPTTGNLWETENGPECNDEVNRIGAGANYGWGPNASCPAPADPTSTSIDGVRPVAPQLTFTPTIAPTGIVVCHDCGLGRGSNGAVFFGDYNVGQIHRATLGSSGDRIVGEEVVADASSLVLSLELGPDRSIYFSSYIAIFRLEIRGGGRPTPTQQAQPDLPARPSSEDGPNSRSIAPTRVTGGPALLIVGLLVLLVVAIGWFVGWLRNADKSSAPVGPDDGTRARR